MSNTEQNSVVFSVEGNKVVPILLDFSALPRANPKRTSARVKVYSGLALHQGRAGIYLIGREWKRGVSAAPVGAILRFEYSTGSWGNVYHSYSAFFVVAEVGDNTFVLHDTVRGHDAEVRVKNLVLLPTLGSEDRAWAEAEILNSGWRPSEYDPVRSLFCYWMRDRVHERAAAAATTVTATTEEAEEELAVEEPEEVEQPLPLPVEEVKPRELEVEFEQPPVPAATSQPAAPSKPELVKIYLLSMRLPSKYLVQSVEYDSGKTSVREVRFWAGKNAKIASRLESIRRMALARVSRVFAFVPEYGTWIAVTEQALAEAQRVSEFVVEELRKLGLDRYAERYTIRAIPIFLQPEDARELLGAAVRHLSADVETLKKRIEEAEREQDKRALRRLEQEKSYHEALLQAFRNYLAQLG